MIRNESCSSTSIKHPVVNGVVELNCFLPKVHLCQRTTAFVALGLALF